MLKRVEVYKESGFSEKALKRYLVHDSPYFKVTTSMDSYV